MAELTARVPPAFEERSESALTGAVIAQHAESEDDFIESLKQSNTDIENGFGVPHDEAMRRIRAHVARYPSTRL